MYIVIEGQDGTGKSTQAKKIAEYFREKGKEVLVIEEPNGDLAQAQDLHDMILTRGYDLEPMTNVLLFTAARMELWKKLMEPVLKRGGVVISARNYWSTLAYQGYGEGVSRRKIVRITKDLLPEKYFTPDFGFILVSKDAARLSRQDKRGQKQETFEARSDSFQEKVNKGYLKIAEDFKLNLIDGNGTIEEVFREILRFLD